MAVDDEEKVMGGRRLNLPLNPMRAFSVAARHKTFTAAAQEMGISQVAISRQIAILEDYLNVQLFERGSRSARLTEVGRAYGAEISAIFEDLERSTHRMLRHETERTIHLRLYPSVAHFWLLPRLPDFYARHPGLRVRMDTTVAPLDFRGTHLDAAIQLGGGPWREARSRHLFDEEIDVVCSPAQLQRRPVSGPADLAGADLLHSRYRRRAWQDWAEANNVDLPHREGVEFDSSLLTYSAAQQGLGFAIGQLRLLEVELSAGRLFRPLLRPVPTGASFHVVWPTTLSVAPKTRSFIDWLLDQVGHPPEFVTPRRSA
ncbi:LysR substrate-binding domain-containing protein [Paracoccus sp. SM22M-07]|uniref:LysR substrate-binding domain-containing protein n=1 Tax=Paracoccus sp. SM22M-07 TaxID=1520813 RepID=UPI000AFC6608|nr:LysR substrate-binding domain-containing protein [Paracoccus sp. SM22M-07]